MNTMRLDELLARSAKDYPARTAIEDAEGHTLSYRQLGEASDAIRDQLLALGVRSGDRVGVYVEKSPAAVAAIFGVLKSGAAYVPVDPTAPAERNAYILLDCAVRVAIVQRSLSAGLEKCGAGAAFGSASDLETPAWLGGDLVAAPGPRDCPSPEMDEPLAYILYTSGSTGKPKGVMHSHNTALSFVDWCSEKFRPGPEDRFSSHAPFHFDLSILDLYVSIKHGASIILIGEDLGKRPMRLGPLIAERKISVWYSTPSILRLLVEFGGMDEHDYSELRLVIFAGEVFPIKHLKALRRIWSQPRYFNLYGPTETNVCTYCEATSELVEGREKPLPIGAVCENDKALVLDSKGKVVDRGLEGELLISGGSVMLGYWNLPSQNLEAFYVDDRGRRWYRTGDIVRESEDGVFTYLGRRDRMIKRRGFRVELGEIEAALHRHPEISEAAVVASSSEDGDTLVRAFLSWNGEDSPSTIRLKQFCVQFLPVYMVPDRFDVLPTLPKTSTDKVDYQKLTDVD